MAQFVNIYKCDLHKGPVVTSLHQVFLGDVEANRVGVHVTDNGEDVTLSGTCSGTAILCNGGTIALTGTVDGSLAYVDLPSAVYTVEGPVEIYVTLTQGDQTTTLLTAHGNAVRTDSGVVIDPGTIIPSVAALISDIDEAVASIPADYSDLLGTIAPDFSSSTAYTAGQYVWYSGTLYRFTSDHAAGSWTGTDAIAAEIGEDVADLKGAITPYHEDSMVATRAYTSGDILMVGAKLYKTKTTISSGATLSSSNIAEITLREYLSGTGAAPGAYAHGEGEGSRAVGQGSHAEGYMTVVPSTSKYGHSEGMQTAILNGNAAHVEGYKSQANGVGAHAEGSETFAAGSAHSEGYKTEASATYSHAEGRETEANKPQAHAEGKGTTASGTTSHAEGEDTVASGDVSHAEGYGSTASGIGSHAEGTHATASGVGAHAEGTTTTASGSYSHAEGEETIANHRNQHVFGTLNVADPSSAIADDPGTYVEIVGNGQGVTRSNARTLDWSGNEVLAGGLTLHAGTQNEMNVSEDIADLKGAFDTLEDKLVTVNKSYSTASKWATGQYRQSDGEIRAETSRIRMYDYISSDIDKIVSENSDYKLILAAWNTETSAYIGWYTGAGFANSGTAYTFTELDINKLRNDYPDYSFKLMAKKSSITISDAIAVIAFIDLVYVTDTLETLVNTALPVDTTLSVTGKAADAKITGDKIAEINADVFSAKNDLFLTRKVIPSYYFAVPETPANFEADEYLNQKINSIPSGKHFIFITDPHWKNNNAKNSTALLKYVKGKVGIKDIFQGGDILNQETSKYSAKVQMALYMNEMRDAFGDDMLTVQGNHDKNVANLTQVLEQNPGLTEADVALPYDEIYDTEMAYFADRVHFANWDTWLTQTGATGTALAELEAYRKMHYYLDDDDQKIRYVVLCASNTNYNGVVRTYFGAVSLNEANLQYEWFRDTIKSTPSGYDIVVVSHVIVNDKKDGTGTWLPYAQIGYYLRMMGGLATKTNVTITNIVGTSSADGALLDTFFASGNHTMIFNDATGTHDVMFMIGGDCHCDVLCEFDKTTNTASFIESGDSVSLSTGYVPAVTTLCDARAVPSRNQDGVTETMTAGTITEQCFEVVTITSDKRIVLTRFGAGQDRTIQIT